MSLFEKKDMVSSQSLPVTQSDNVRQILDRAMDATGGLLRLTPTWVPRSFLHPGKRIRLHPDDYYAMGAERGGIDERWFGSTTEKRRRGLVFVVLKGKHFFFETLSMSAAQL